MYYKMMATARVKQSKVPALAGNRPLSHYRILPVSRDIG